MFRFSKENWKFHIRFVRYHIYDPNVLKLGIITDSKFLINEFTKGYVPMCIIDLFGHQEILLNNNLPLMINLITNCVRRQVNKHGNLVVMQ